MTEFQENAIKEAIVQKWPISKSSTGKILKMLVEEYVIFLMHCIRSDPSSKKNCIQLLPRKSVPTLREANSRPDVYKWKKYNAHQSQFNSLRGSTVLEKVLLQRFKKPVNPALRACLLWLSTLYVTEDTVLSYPLAMAVSFRYKPYQNQSREDGPTKILLLCDAAS
jgi:hypothetical protein